MANESSPNKALEIILSGIRAGDDNGGPTRTSELLADSFTQQNGFDPQDISNRYLNWWKSDAFDTGPVFALVFSRVTEGMRQDQAVREADRMLGSETAGCNPAHRISPLAAFRFIETNDIPVIARTEARLTHWHSSAGDAASIVALLCRFMIEGNEWAASKSLAEELDPKGWRTVCSGKISHGGYAPDVVRTAISFLDEKQPLERAKAFAGPANYSPVLVGVFSAVREAYC